MARRIARAKKRCEAFRCCRTKFRRSLHRRRTLASRRIRQILFALRSHHKRLRLEIALENGRPPRATGPHAVKYEIQIAGKSRPVELVRAAAGWQISVDGAPTNAD